MGVVFRFVWVLLVFHGLSESLDIQSYIAQKEKEVRSMAAEIVRLDESRCDFARNCTCSRHACTPIDGSANGSANYDFDLGCQPMGDSYNCGTAYSSAKKSQCHIRKLNYAMSYFRVAPNASSYAYKIPDEIPNEMCSTICMTKGLENSFKNSVNRSNHETFYFGSADGVQRVYPGQEAPSDKDSDLCGLYNPRKRPWYNGAISIQTQYFILVYHGSLSGSEVTSQKSIKAIAASQQIVEEFVKTLSPKDALNIVTFDDTDATLITENKVLITDDASSTNSQINNIINDIRSITTTQSTVPPSIDGFIRAVSAVSDMKFRNSNYFKVMLLFTNGMFATALNSKIQHVSETLTNNSMNLLIYSFEDSTNLQNLARQSNGNFKVINSYYENPLYQISSYFNFMALARKTANDTPFWSNYYTDSDGRGRIITVSNQAVSSNGSLIGVAAIDITESVLGDLSIDLGDRYGFRPRYPNRLFNVTVKSTDTVCNPRCDVSRAVCPRLSSKTFTELNCCDTCPGKEDGRNWIVIFGPVGAAILVIIGVALTMWWMMKKKNQKSKNNPIFLSPTSTDLGPYR